VKYNITVTTRTNGQPVHEHTRHEGIKAGKVQRIFFDTLAEEYARLDRGQPTYLDGWGSVEHMSITMHARYAGGQSTVRVEAFPARERPA
jgi:hypothetical protein